MSQLYYFWEYYIAILSFVVVSKLCDLICGAVFYCTLNELVYKLDTIA